MEYQPNSSGAVGYMIVEAKTADGALPVTDAVVTVSSSDGMGNIKITMETDRSGRTERLALPTVSGKTTTSPGNAHPYLSYDISVVADDFYPFLARKVAVFENVTTLQPAMLIARSAYDSDNVYPRQNLTVRDEEPPALTDQQQ